MNVIANKLKYTNIGKNGKNIIWQYILVTLNKKIEPFPSSTQPTEITTLLLSSLDRSELPQSAAVKPPPVLEE